MEDCRLFFLILLSLGREEALRPPRARNRLFVLSFSLCFSLGICLLDWSLPDDSLCNARNPGEEGIEDLPHEVVVRVTWRMHSIPGKGGKVLVVLSGVSEGAKQLLCHGQGSPKHTPGPRPLPVEQEYCTHFR